MRIKCTISFWGGFFAKSFFPVYRFERNVTDILTATIWELELWNRSNTAVQNLWQGCGRIRSCESQIVDPAKKVISSLRHQRDCRSQRLQAFLMDPISRNHQYACAILNKVCSDNDLNLPPSFSRPNVLSFMRRLAWEAVVVWGDISSPSMGETARRRH